MNRFNRNVNKINLTKNVIERKASKLGFCEGNLHFSSAKGFVMKLGYRLKAFLHRAEPNQCHVFFIGLHQNFDFLNVSVLAKNLS